MSDRFRVLVGLGNPGERFEYTRHNVGFMVVETLAQRASVSFENDPELHSAVCRPSPDLVLVKPATGMNDSGLAVSAVLDRFSASPDCLLVVFDDVSLPTGKMRFKFDGGAGGHHGIESIIEHLGGRRDFHRLKVAVGPDPGGAKRIDYVLEQLRDTARENLERIVAVSSDACAFWLDSDTPASASRFNGVTVALA